MKKAPTLLLALVVAAVRGDDCSSYDWDDKVACDEDSDCVWLQNWWSCRDNCEGWDEDGCDEADHCAWSDSSNTCSLSCEHKYSDDDGCWFEGGSYDVDDDHRDCFSEGLCIHLRPVATSRPPKMSSSRAGRYELRERLLRVDGLGRARDVRRGLLSRAGLSHDV